MLSFDPSSVSSHSMCSLLGMAVPKNHVWHSPKRKPCAVWRGNGRHRWSLVHCKSRKSDRAHASHNRFHNDQGQCFVSSYAAMDIVAPASEKVATSSPLPVSNITLSEPSQHPQACNFALSKSMRAMRSFANAS